MGLIVGKGFRELRLGACLSIALILLLGLGSTLTSADAHYPLKGGKKCRPISFKPNTDWGSFNIKAKGIGCRKARAWIRRGRGGLRSIPWQNCVKRVHPSGLLHTDYKCQSPNGLRKLVWIST